MDVPIYLGPHFGVHTRPDEEKVGGKAAGLWDIPTPWTPPFIVIGTELHRLWRASSLRDREAAANQVVDAIRTLLSSKEALGLPAKGFILRSSAMNEDIRQRGELESADFSELDYSSVRDFLDRTYARDPDVTGDTGLIAQPLLVREQSIHLSNERRFSKVVNEWMFETHGPGGFWPVPAGCNSSQAPPQPVDKQITLRVGTRLSDIRLSLRQIGKWASRTYSTRVHLELVVAGNQMFLVQLDKEHDYGGIDPRKVALVSTPGDPNCARALQLYRIGAATVFRKLTNISDFDVRDYKPPHRLYWITAEAAQKQLAEAEGEEEFRNELAAVTGGRLVLREDRDPSLEASVDGFNLYRSDTLNAERAVSKLKERIAHWQDKNVPLSAICFIIHGFIPAKAGAWAQYDSGSKRTRVHALWGLPDGLQYLTPDEYEFDHITGVVSPRIQFKEFFLAENSAGEWKKEAIALDAGRALVLSDKEVREIATLSQQIAEKVGKDTHVMFFCGIPSDAELGSVLPWYRTPEAMVYEAKRTKRLIRRDIKAIADLNELNPAELVGTVLRLRPEVEDFRNNELVKAVGDFAAEHDIPVEVMGSPLAHAYYLLRSRRATVFTSFASDYERVRSKQEFGKLVRDGIVSKIGNSGERTVSFTLSPDERPRALFGKLIEEGAELVSAPDSNGRLEELSDVYEVIRSWAELEGFQMDEVVAEADEKRRKRGGFLRGEVLVGTGTKRQRDDLKFGRSRTFEHVTAPTVSGSNVTIPLGRFGFLADGTPTAISVPEANLTVEVGLTSGGDFTISLKPTATPDEPQGDFWPSPDKG